MTSGRFVWLAKNKNKMTCHAHMPIYGKNNNKKKKKKKKKNSFLQTQELLKIMILSVVTMIGLEKMLHNICISALAI